LVESTSTLLCTRRTCWDAPGATPYLEMIGTLVRRFGRPAASATAAPVLSPLVSSLIRPPSATPPPPLKIVPAAAVVTASVADAVNLMMARAAPPPPQPAPPLPPPPSASPIIQAGQPIAQLPASAAMTSLQPGYVGPGPSSVPYAPPQSQWLPPPSAPFSPPLSGAGAAMPLDMTRPPEPSSSPPTWALALGAVAVLGVGVLIARGAR
jgi:hypothetical protein